MGLNKKGNTNNTCAAKKEQISIWLADNAVNKITVTMTCSKPRANASLNQINEMILMFYTDHTGQINT